MTVEAKQENPDAKLMVSDITNALSMIDAAVERGAFKGNEISHVGAHRDHLVNVVNAQAEENEEGKEKPFLSATDINTTLNLVDVAISRGAFKGSEASGVGKVRDKYNEIVEMFRAKAEQQQETEQPDSSE